MTISTIENKNLILFTESYPYGSGEQFLETEVPYLVDKFREVIIIPSRMDGPRRNVPDSIMIECSLAQENIDWYKDLNIYKIIRSGLMAVTSTLFYKEIFNSPLFITDHRSLMQVISYIHCSIKVSRWLLIYIKSSDIILENTVLYTYWLSPVTLGIILAKSKFDEIKVVSRVHGADLYRDRHIPPYLPFRQIILNDINRVYAISEHGFNYLTQYYNIYNNKFALSKLGVNNPKNDTPCSNDGKFRIVSCSFLLPVKRIELLMEGIRIFAERHQNSSIIWTHLGDGPLRTKLEKDVKIMPASITCHFKGMLSNDEIMNYYRTNPVDVFINASESEGIPVSIMEAQSCGIPVIATAVGGTPEIVNNENGILLEENPKPGDIADALELFASECEEYLKKRNCSKTNWYLKYNAYINYNKFCDNLLTL